MKFNTRSPPFTYHRLFRSWGRIGTTIGDNKLESFHTFHTAKEHFTSLYMEKTGNPWENRHSAVKYPGLFSPIDIDYGEEEAAQSMDITDSASKLHQSVQDLMHLIFDVKAMKRVMMEFELDTEKMPLGKLSKKQMQNALKVLSELQALVNNNGERARLIDASNRFYTLIPHSFGIDNPPVLGDAEMIKVTFF